MDSGNAMEFLMLIRMNQSFHGLLGKRIASYKFCLGRTCISITSITIQFINENEVVNGGRYPFLLYVFLRKGCGNT